MDDVIVKQYPRSRAAVVQAAAVNGGENKMFGSLFNHIKSNNIAMSAPVDMTWSDPDGADHAATETAMAFIYGDPTLGHTGPDGVVQVVDLPAQMMLSIGVRGSYSKKNFAEGLEQLKKWLAPACRSIHRRRPAPVSRLQQPICPLVHEVRRGAVAGGGRSLKGH